MKNGRIFSSEVATINQLLPHRNKWAYDLYLKGQANNWLPSEVPMLKDVEQWRSRDILSDDERLLVKRCLGFFAGGESLVSNNLLLGIFGVVTDAECRQYIIRQTFEESVHNQTIVYICESLSLSIEEVYEAYQSISSIKAKDDFLMAITTDMATNRPNLKTAEGKREALRNLIAFYLICEGTFFYSGFAMLLAMGRQGKLPGISEQVQYTLRDECVTRDTEFLTPHGWVRADTLGDADYIAQYYPDGRIDFVLPTKRSMSHADDIYHFTNEQGHVDLAVSKNHRIVRLNKSGELVIDAAHSVRFHVYCKHLMAGLKCGGSVDRLSVLDRFRLAFQADGSFQPGKYRNGNHCGYIQVKFYLKKLRKIVRLNSILEELGFEYSTSPSSKGGTDYSVKVKPGLMSKLLDWVELSDVSSNWCKDFIEELAEWDGHRPSVNRITWGSVEPYNASVVQAVACLANYRTHLKTIPDDRKETFSDYHRVQICKNRNYIRGACVKTEIKPYNDLMFGVEVPSGMIIVRRNGAVAITGNSVHIQFGTQLVNTIIQQEPDVWDAKFRRETVEHFKKAVELEICYAKDVLPNGILGLNSEQFVSYTHYIANRRLTSIGLPASFGKARNPFPWMTETIDLTKVKNFFETRVTEYQGAGALEDDF